MKAWPILLLFVSAAALAARADDAQDPDRDARLRFVQDKFAEWSLLRVDASQGETSVPLKNHPAPILRYTNPSGGLVRDGSLFIWRDGSRPVAACSFSIRGPDEPNAVYFEMTSLVGTPLRCERGGQVRWTPKSGGLIDQPVPDTAAPEDRPVARLTSMRNIARRFQAENRLRDGTPSALRLMPQPVDRFQDDAHGVLDAALFAFVEANDPEMLLIVEARKTPQGEAAWRYTVARMTSREIQVRLDGKEVFAAPNFWQGPKSLEDPYLESKDGQMILDSASAPSTPVQRPLTPSVKPGSVQE